MKNHSAQTSSVSPFALLRLIYTRRTLLGQLVRRETFSRYKGSALGVLWAVLTPLLMLTVFTFVFSEIFKSRWPTPEGSASTGGKAEFALVLFAGLTVFNFFSECIQKAPNLIAANPSYVKKIVFPLELLPIVSALAALFTLAISAGLLLFLQWALWSRFPGTVVLLPLVLLPLFLQVLGLTWFLSALSVFLRDIGQTIGVAVTALLFLSPIFFPSKALPERWQFVSNLNPLAFPIEQTRQVLIWGISPPWPALALSMVVSAAIAWLGYIFFQKTRRGFADVL